MIIDIFTSFDPSSFTFLVKEFNLWLLPILFIFLFLSSYWLIPSNHAAVIYLVIKLIENQVNQTFTKNLVFSYNFITALFTTIVLSNLWGIIPYSFSITRHLIFTFIISTPIWLGIIISSANTNPYYTVAHLLPSGAPNWLNPFLVMIETISITVRPLTLAFRLAANIRAGHVVITLIRIYLSVMFFGSPFYTIIALSTNIFYLSFEFGICLIQGYIFCLLLTLYSDDHQV